MLVYDDRAIVDGPGACRPGPRSTVLSRPCGGSWPAARDRPSTSISGSVPTAGPALRPPSLSDVRRLLPRRRPGLGLRAAGPDQAPRRSPATPGWVAAVEALRDRFVYGPEPFDLDGYRRMRRLQIEQLVQPGTDQRQVQPGRPGRRRVLRPGPADRPRRSRPDACGRPTPSAPSPPWRPPAASAPPRPGTLRPATASSASLIDALRVVHGHAQGPDGAAPPDRTSSSSWPGGCASAEPRALRGRAPEPARR